MYAKRKFKRSTRKGGKSKLSRRGGTSALTIAKKALKQVNRLRSNTEETKFMSKSGNPDLFNNASGFWNAAHVTELTSLSGQNATWLFNADPVQGNKYFLKGVKGTWEIHMDNVNNEEETCNFTVAVVRPKGQCDSFNLADHVSTIQGQTYFDPRFFKIYYYKHFTRTMGGTSPGTAGEMLRWGSFYIPVNKTLRLIAEGAAGNQTGNVTNLQDRLYFMVFTDNTTADTESPRMNWRTMAIIKDVDINS